MKHLFDQLEQSRWQLIQALAEAEEFNLKHLRDRFGRFAEKVGKENPIAESVNRQKQIKQQERNIEIAKKTGGGIVGTVAAILAVKKVGSARRVNASKKAGAAALDRLEKTPDIQAALKELGVDFADVKKRVEALHDLKGIPDRHHKHRAVDASRFVRNVEEMIQGHANFKATVPTPLKSYARPSASQTFEQAFADTAKKVVNDLQKQRDEFGRDILDNIEEYEEQLEQQLGFLWRRSAVQAEVKHGARADLLVKSKGKKDREATHDQFITGLQKNDIKTHSIHIVKPEEFFDRISERHGPLAASQIIAARYFGADPRSDKLKAAVGKRIFNPLSKTLTSIHDPAKSEAALRLETKDILKLNRMAGKPITPDHKIVTMRTDYAGGFNLTVKGEDSLIEAGMDPKVLVHEYGHSLENKNSDMQAKIQAFRNARSARSNNGKSKIGSIKDALGPVTGYLDEFSQPYSGKVYHENPDPNVKGMTEVTSDALQNLFHTRSLQQQLSKDREHMMTVLGALADD